MHKHKHAHTHTEWYKQIHHLNEADDDSDHGDAEQNNLCHHEDEGSDDLAVRYSSDSVAKQEETAHGDEREHHSEEAKEETLVGLVAVGWVVAVFGHFRQSSTWLEFDHVTDVLVDLVHDGGGYEAVLDGTREEVGSRASGKTRV